MAELVIVPLENVSPHTFSKSIPNQQIQGKVISFFPYNAGTKMTRFTLQSLQPSKSDTTPRPKIDIELKGFWAKGITFAMEEKVMLMSDSAETKRTKDSSFKILFESGVVGHSDKLPKGFRVGVTKLKNVPNPVSALPVVSAIQQVPGGMTETPSEPEAAVQKSPQPISAKRSQTIVTAEESGGAQKETVSPGLMNKNGSMIPSDHPAKKTKTAKIARPLYWPKNMSLEVYGTNFVGLDQLEARKIAMPSQPIDTVVMAYHDKPAVNRGGVWKVTFTIVDRESEKFPLMLDLMAYDVQSLPVFEDGDVILFRGLMYIQAIGGYRVTGQNKFQFEIFKREDLLNSDSILSPNPRPSGKIEDEIYFNMAEIDYARSLARWGKETFTIRPTVVVSARVNLQEKKKPRGMMEMKDITAGIFVNIIVEVIHIRDYLSGSSLDRVLLKVTDYTENEDLWDMDGESNNFPGLSGKRVLEVTFWSPHFKGWERWKQGTVLYLDNMNLKISSAGVLEGKFIGKLDATIQVIENSNGRLKKGGMELWGSARDSYDTLVKRKTAYWDEVNSAKDYDADAVLASAKLEAQVDQLPPTPITANQGVKANFAGREYTTFADVKKSTDEGSDAYYRMRVNFGGFSTHERDAKNWIVALCPECKTGVKLPPTFTQCDIHAKVSLEYFFGIMFLCPQSGEKMKILIDKSDSEEILPNLPPTNDMRFDGPDLNLLKNRFKGIQQGNSFDICVRAWSGIESVSEVVLHVVCNFKKVQIFKESTDF